MAPLEHIATGVDNTVTESWDQRGSFSTITTIGPLLREAAWVTYQASIHASITRIPGVKNIEADAHSGLTHLPVPAFLKSFNTFFPHLMPWRLSFLTSGVTRRLHNKLITKQSTKASPLTNYARTTQCVKNGIPSAHCCAYQPNYKASGTRSPSYISLITRSE